MSIFPVCLFIFLALIGPSSGNFCICKEGAGDSAYQKNLDYACGNGADCGPIQPNGTCYNPNTLKDHCSYAVNSYFHKKAQSGATCDFSGTASTTTSPPSSSNSSCYSSSPSGGGSPPSPSNPSPPNPPSTPPPSTSPSTTTTASAHTTVAM